MSSTRRFASISGLEMRVLANELSGLSGWYVSNIHSLGENQVFRFKSPQGDADVVVSPLLGAWVTSRPAHGITNEFTTALRRELLRTRLEAVTQLGLDRVLYFRFTDGARTTEMVLELMPPGNIVITDAAGTVRLALREFKSAHRSIGKGRTYVPPPQNRASPEAIEEGTLGQVLGGEGTVGRALGRGLSLPRRYVDEILSKASLRQDDPTPLPPAKVREVAEAIAALVSKLRDPTPSLIEDESGVALMVAEPSHGELVETAVTMSALMDKAFAGSLLEQVQPPEQEDREVREAEVTLKRLRDQAEVLTQKAGRFRQLAQQVRGATSVDDALVLASSAGVDSRTKERVGSLASVAAVASGLFDEAKSAEAEVRRIGEVIRDLDSKLAKAKKKKDGAEPNPAVRLVRRERKEWYQKFRWFFTSEGKLAVGGRDAQSNSILVKKHLDEGDVAYHADLFGSPFFILKGGMSQTPSEVRQLGQATASFSSAWKTGLTAADAYWVGPGQVSSSAPSGEYLARGSFVIRGKKNFVTRNPVEIAIGMDDAGRLVAGPEQAVMSGTRAYLVLTPSREKSSETAKKVAAELRRLYGPELAGNGVDDVARALPTGGGKIIRRRDLGAADDGARSVPGPEQDY